jgi:type IV secretory pathway VirB3-like protein
MRKTQVPVAAHRPALVRWVWLPLNMWLGLFVSAALCVMITKTPLSLLWTPAVWWGMKEWIKDDYNAPWCCILWCRTKALSWDAHIWGGASPDPFPIPRDKHSRGMSSRA